MSSVELDVPGVMQYGSTVSRRTKVIKKRKLKTCKENTYQQPFLQFEIVPFPRCTSSVKSNEQEEDCYSDYELYDDFSLSNAKRGGTHSRSTGYNKRPNIRPNKRLNLHTEIKEVKRSQRIKENWAEQKSNIDKDLLKRGLKKFGFDIYQHMNPNLVKANPSSSYLKPKCGFQPHIKREDHPSAKKYELCQSNVPKEQAFLTRLIDLQHRELTPEDYELLLLLEDTVAPKTINSHTLSAIVTVQADLNGLVGELCTICMENYETEQMAKKLPCEHYFHVDCIDHWLSSSSQNCPLDGLAISI